MIRTFRPGTVLSLDLHRKRYGYAVLKPPSVLLDWGVRRRHHRCQSRKVSDLRHSLRKLLELWRPSLVLIAGPSTEKKSIQERWTGLLSEVSKRGIPIYMITGNEVRSALGSEFTKYAIAKLVVQKFPFLAFTLPAPRKIWSSEDYRMSIFSAVATALTTTQL